MCNVQGYPGRTVQCAGWVAQGDFGAQSVRDVSANQGIQPRSDICTGIVQKHSEGMSSLQIEAKILQIEVKILGFVFH